jgi:hypothetical protein
MIWYFIAGFIAGAVGVFLLGAWIAGSDKQTKGRRKDDEV